MSRQIKAVGVIAVTVMSIAGMASVADAGREEPLKPFAVPKDLAAWESKRSQIRKTVLDALDLSRHFESTAAGPAAKAGVSPDVLLPRTGRRINVFAHPPVKTPGQRFPAIMLLHDHWPTSVRGELVTAPDEMARLSELLQRGYAVLLTYSPAFIDVVWVARENAPKDEPTWPETVRDDPLRGNRGCLPPRTVDPARVGVVGGGLAGTRAWWLMALDDRIACGAAIGGISRISDWYANEGELLVYPRWPPGQRRCWRRLTLRP